MYIYVRVHPTYTTAHDFAKVTLANSGGSALSEIDVDYHAFREGCCVPIGLPSDFLLLASVVYAVDKVVRRDEAADKWTRELSVTLPVSDPSVWDALRTDLGELLGFLTGDQWQFAFEPLASRLYRPKPRHRMICATRLRLAAAKIRGEAVCLYSGGLDSLIGALDWLEDHPEGTLCLTGHHDGDVPGPKSDQEAVYRLLRQEYGKQVVLLPVRVGERYSTQGNVQTHPDRETTYRSRSLLFLALGLCAASALGDGTTVLLPENGTIALNVPLTPSRRGSCSTRTAHPQFVRMLQSIWDRLGLNHPIVNPYITKTKGECIAECQNQTLLRAAIPFAVSCAKRGHKSTWKRRTGPKQCGRCMPCIYRRASLHKIAQDTEVYGNDICRGEVDVTSDDEASDDLRACLSFLRRRANKEDIARLLLENGRLELELLDDYASTVARAMDEIRRLIEDKATAEIQARAGVVQEG